MYIYQVLINALSTHKKSHDTYLDINLNMNL